MRGEQWETAWEYLMLPEAENSRLAELGRDGWELVAVGGESGARRLYLKRPTRDFRERVTLEQRRNYYRSLEFADRTIEGRGDGK